MKVRTNRRRIMAKIKYNKQYIWYVTPFRIKAEMAEKTRQRIREIVDKTFPELRCVNVRT